MDTTSILEQLGRIEQLLSCQKEVLSFEEARIYMGVSHSYLYKLTASGDIPHSKPKGKLIYFERTKLNVWLLRNPIKGPYEIEDAAIQKAFYLQK